MCNNDEKGIAVINIDLIRKKKSVIWIIKYYSYDEWFKKKKNIWSETIIGLQKAEIAYL